MAIAVYSLIHTNCCFSWVYFLCGPVDTSSVTNNSVIKSEFSKFVVGDFCLNKLFLLTVMEIESSHRMFISVVRSRTDLATKESSNWKTQTFKDKVLLPSASGSSTVYYY